MECLLVHQSETGDLLSKIPNHHHTSRPLVMQERSEETATDRPQSSLAELNPQFLALRLEDKDEKARSWPNRKGSIGALPHRKPKRKLSKGSSHFAKDESTLRVLQSEAGVDDGTDDELVMIFGEMDSPKLAVRCPAPTPMTMLTGKAISMMGEEEEEEQPDPLSPFYKRMKSSKITGSGLKTKRGPPPRPHGLPPLDLSLLRNTTPSPEPQDPGRNNLHVISPRVQKPAATVAGSPPGGHGAPDQNKSVVSILSPRSAFSTKDTFMEN